MTYRYDLTVEGDVFLELHDDGRLSYTGPWVNGSPVRIDDLRRYSNSALYLIIGDMRDNDADHEHIPGRQLTDFAIMFSELVGGVPANQVSTPHVVSAALMCDLAVPAALLDV